MTSNLITAALTLPSATVSRSLGVHLGEVVNVKDFGAIGNSDPGDDDGPAIQAAIDYAWGPYNNPHHGAPTIGQHLNRKLYFPPGYYYIYSPLSEKTVVDVRGDGTGSHPSTYDKCLVQVASTAGLANGDMVLIRGAGGNNFANGSCAIGNVTATTFTLRNKAWVQAAFGGAAHNYTSGGTVNVPGLKARVSGSVMYGAGRHASIVRCMTPNAACFSTNGFQNMLVQDMAFNAAPGGIAFDYNSDGGNYDDPSFGIGAVSNTFMNLGLGGANENTDYGITMGMGVFQCDSSTLFNCYIGGCNVAGLFLGNQNCLVHSVYGGNFSSCRKGIWVQSGSCPTIQGVAFQNYQVDIQPAVDIVIEGGAADDSYAITACRTESHNFISCPAQSNMVINGCSMANVGDPGFFLDGGGKVVMQGCDVIQGHIAGNNLELVMNGCTFTTDGTTPKTDYLTAGAQDNFGFLQITPQPVKEITAATHAIVSADCGHKIQFNSASGQTVTVQPTANIFLKAGARIEVQRTGAGLTTFVGGSGVTIRSSNGLKLRAQWSCATLTCDGTDLWTLTGDTTT